MNANAQPSLEAAPQQPPPTPDITLSGVTVDRLFQHLTNPTVLVKDMTGGMHSFVDPQPVIAVLREAAVAVLKRQNGGEMIQAFAQPAGSA